MSAGMYSASSRQPATQAMPPETIEKRMLLRDATPPASTLPSRGALVTWARYAADTRPCKASGVVANMIVPRITALKASAQPAAARRTTASGSVVTNPNAVIATPHNVAATTIPTPWRRTCAIQPESTEATSAPAVGDAYRTPTTNPPE